MPILSPKVTPYYGGGQVSNPANVLQTTSAPSTTFTQDALGTIQVDYSNQNAYMLVSKSGGEDTWALIGGQAGYPATPYMVGPVGQAGYQTIQSAIDAAHAADLPNGATIYIQPGTYEEDLTLYVGLSFVAVEANVDTNRVEIIGTHTPDPSNGSISFQHINFYGTDKIFYSTEEGQAYMVFETCNWSISEDGYIFNLPNWTNPVDLPSGPAAFACVNCGDLSTGASGFFYNINDAFIVILFSYVGSYVGGGSTTPMIVSGIFQASEADFYCPLQILGSGSSYCILNGFHGVGITVQGSTIGYIANNSFDNLTDPAFTMNSSGNWIISENYIDTSATNAISGIGSGSLLISGVSFADSYGIADTLTLSTDGAMSAGSKILVNTGTNASIGTSSALSSGSVTVSTTAVTDNSLIFLSRKAASGTLGNLSVGTQTTGVGFTITSDSSSDTSTVNWIIYN